MRSGTVRSLVAVAIAVTPLAAIASQLTTPLMPAIGMDTVMCISTNVEVTITPKNAFGGTQAPVSNSCSNPLDAGDTCFTTYGANVDVWCAFQAKGRIKASINAIDATGHVLSSLPATK